VLILHFSLCRGDLKFLTFLHFVSLLFAKESILIVNNIITVIVNNIITVPLYRNFIFCFWSHFTYDVCLHILLPITFDDQYWMFWVTSFVMIHITTRTLMVCVIYMFLVGRNCFEHWIFLLTGQVNCQGSLYCKYYPLMFSVLKFFFILEMFHLVGWSFWSIGHLGFGVNKLWDR
jgi:hypothetical protein